MVSRYPIGQDRSADWTAPVPPPAPSPVPPPFPVVEAPPTGIPTTYPISRIGLWILVVGVVILGAGVIASGVQFQLLASGYYTGTNAFLQLELGYAVEDLAAGVGVVLAAIGWVVDRRSIDRARGTESSGDFGLRALVGFVLIMIGALMVASCAFFFGSIEYSVYSMTPVTWLQPWQYATFEVTAGVGVLVILAGWVLHHVAVLNWTETHPG